MKEQQQSSGDPFYPAEEQEPSRLGLRAARWAGMALGLFFVIQGPWVLATAEGELFPWVRGSYLMVYGLLLLAPLERVNAEHWWLRGYVVLVAATVFFVFLMIATVMFGYMEAAERGERLGVPGREGTMIFVALLQVPVALFLRKPDLLD